MARRLIHALLLACSSVFADDADLARLSAAPLSEEEWHSMLQARGSDPTFMARAYRVGCLRRIQEAGAFDTAASAEAVRLGLVLAEQLASRADIAGLLVCRGRMAEAEGQPAKAVADYERALGEAVAAHDAGLQVMAMALRGELRHAQGDWFNAQKDLLTAQQLAQGLPDGPVPHHALMALAQLHADPRLAQDEEALDLYRALLTRLAGRNLARVRLGLAVVHLRQERYEQAQSALLEAEQAFASLKDSQGAASTQLHRAELWLRLDEPAKALAALDGASPQGRADSSTLELTRTAALRRLGRLNEAQAALAKAKLALSDSPITQARWQQEAAELAALQGQWQAAFQARTAESTWLQALQAERQEAQQASLRAEWALEREADEKQRRKDQAATAKQEQRLHWALLLVTALGLLGWFSWWRRRAAQ